MEETCLHCCICQVSISACNKREFKFPEDYECGVGEISFPKRCIEFIDCPCDEGWDFIAIFTK